MRSAARGRKAEALRRSGAEALRRRGTLCVCCVSVVFSVMRWLRVFCVFGYADALMLLLMLIRDAGADADADADADGLVLMPMISLLSLCCLPAVSLLSLSFWFCRRHCSVVRVVVLFVVFVIIVVVVVWLLCCRESKEHARQIVTVTMINQIATKTLREDKNNTRRPARQRSQLF